MQEYVNQGLIPAAQLDAMMAAANRGTTVIVATHDIALVERYRMRTLKLEDGRLSEVDLEGDGR